MTERRTAPQPQALRLTRLRELDSLASGTVVMATSNPSPRYFRRVPGGWAACDHAGHTALQRVLAAELEGWPDVLASRDLRRPVSVVALPHELPDDVRRHELRHEKNVPTLERVPAPAQLRRAVAS